MRLPYILKKPILTEKSLEDTGEGIYTFKVLKSATKGQIKQAVEEHFKVDVVSVRTTKLVGKRRRTGKKRQEVVYPDGKKAMVGLKKDQKIDLFEMETK
jgi:large subunit ribosomal protein L23